MADVILSDGREITFDMSKVSLREYRAIFDKDQPQEEEDALISRASGLTVDEYLNLPYPEWRKLIMAFFAVARNPLTNPN